MTDLIYGSGGGKGGGGGGRTASEAPNNLKSIQYAEIIDVISEGPIRGLVNDKYSIFFDDVPLSEFSDAVFEVRLGTQTQTATKIALSGSKETIEAGNLVRKLMDDNVTSGEVVVQIADASHYDAGLKTIDVVVGVPALTYQDMSNGDISGTSVKFNIATSGNTLAFDSGIDQEIKGKCTSMYNASYSIDLSSYPREQYPLYLRITRLTDDSKKSNLQNSLYLSSYTRNFPTKLSYPNTALVTLHIDSEHFTNIPTRSYEIYGMEVKVPTNYNPLTRKYTGSWDGTFKTAWTDNPAWIYYDLVTDTRYGIGEYITENSIDKWELYSISKYCDSVDSNGTYIGVSNGLGGVEPRFTCNTYIQNQDEAFKLLSDLCSIFRGMQYWAGGYFSVAADMPRDPVAQFSPSNVIDGVFNYSGSSLKTRRTAAKVIWNDPTDSYKQKIEYVEANGFVYDETNPNYAFNPINTYGVVQADIAAIGCTSRGQANRVGRWLLYTELYETETITFKTGIENAILLPGSIIKTADPFRQGVRMGGRVYKKLTDNELLLDSPDETLSNGTYSISFITPIVDTNTKINKSSLSNYTGIVTTHESGKKHISIAGSLNSSIIENTIWVATLVGNLEPELWRVVSITQDDEITATITALEYHPGKFDSIEKGLLLEERPVSQIDYGKPSTPETKSKEFNSSGQLVDTNRSNVIDINITSISTTTTSAITSTSTTINCTSTTGFSTTGYIRIDNELMQYTGITATSFTGVTRGVTGLLAASSHLVNSTIFQVLKITSGTGWVKEYLFFQTPSTLGAAAALSWTANSLSYEVKYRRILSTNTSWEVKTTNVPYIELKPLETGLYDVEIVAINAVGRRSDALKRVISILGKSTPPLNVSNLSITKASSGLILKWDANNSDSLQYPDLDLAGYEIRELYYSQLPSSMQEANNIVSWNPTTTTNTKNSIWNSASKAESGLILNTTYTDISASANKYNVFLIKAKDDSDNYSEIPSLIGIKVNPPQIITTASIEVDGTDLVIKWNPPISDLGISYYTVTYNNGSSNITTRCNSTEFRKKLWFTGYEVFDIIPYDIGGNIGPTYSISITVGTLPAPNLSIPTIVGENYILNWTQPNTSGCAPIDYYELRLDQNWGQEDSNLVAKVYGNNYSAKINWSGTRVGYIAARDTSGNYGTSTSRSITTPVPGEVSKLEPTVIDNNVLLSWGTPISGTELPIIEYEVRKGVPSGTWDTATSIGTKTGLFTTSFETVSGTYKYWVAAKNSAGVLGTPKGVAAVVNQPPDYVLATNYFSNFTTKLGTNGSITTSNTHIGIDGELLLPVITNQTWETHFTTNSFDQISDFGNNTYLYPGSTTGYYQEIMDLGTNIAGSTVSIALSSSTISGTPNIVYEVSASQDNITYTTISSTLVNYYTQFRYIKLKIIVTNGIVKFNSLNVRIDIKQRTDSGSKNCLYSDAGGSIVYLTSDKTSMGTKLFKDILSINLTPNIGCTNSAGTVVNTVTALYDFVDVADPLSFKILLLNSANGERLSGSCSYTIRGV